MKKSLFLVPLLAAALVSCSSDEPAEAGGGNTGESSINFMSVNIAMAPEAPGSRASQYGDEYKEGSDGNNYEYGLNAENIVSGARFYFFDSDGKAAVVKSGSSVNYLEWKPGDDETSTDPNIEKVLHVNLIIETKKGDDLPATIIAVVNAPTDLLGTESLSIGDLNGKISDFSSLTNEGQFVMSNSVYANGTTKVEEVSVAGKVKQTALEAEADPVTIFVERVLAKVRLSIDTDLKPNPSNEYYVLVTKKENADGSASSYEPAKDPDGNALYLNLLGWNVTTTADRSYLMKNIDPTWASNLFGADEPWTYPTYSRSYWAINPAGTKYNNFAFKTVDGSDEILLNGAITGFEKKDGVINWTYTQENAAKTAADGVDKPTQVIIAAQIVKEDGTAVTLTEWGGTKYTLNGLKTQFANSVALYYGTTEIEEDVTTSTYHSIEPEDITFEAIENSSLVKAVLSETGKAKDWYGSLAGGEKLSDDEIANRLDLGSIKIWNNGYTYYYTDIRHLNSTEDGIGYYGVVRNHLYDINITAIYGLGTPVYDPSQNIIPEKPEYDESYIAAQIKVLSWRVVSQDAELDWK